MSPLKSQMKISSVSALVSGANRGIGRAIVEELLSRGAKRVYAGSRDPKAVQDLVGASKGRVVAVKLDVTKPADIAAVAKLAGDVNVLINNAGVAYNTSDLAGTSIDNARREMEVNYFAVLAMTQAFAPILKSNGSAGGGGVVVNVASIASFIAFPFFATYCATKAALHSLSQSLRVMLAGQQTRVMTVHPGPIDTDMAKDVEFDKAPPSEVARRIVNAIEDGSELITTDPMADEAFAQWRKDPIEAQRAFEGQLVEA